MFRAPVDFEHSGFVRPDLELLFVASPYQHKIGSRHGGDIADAFR